MGPYRFVEDAPTADVGFVAVGETLAECFCAAAEATLAAMLGNPEALRHDVVRTARVEAASRDLALLRFLEELIYYKDAEGLFLRPTEVAVDDTAEGVRVAATLAGESIDPARHQLAGDVKAVTLHRLRVAQTAAGWEATVVLDL
ncbi:archease [Candidatus Binatia bacterium]|nr:archease [Candidatus Binatia bacterium]